MSKIQIEINEDVNELDPLETKPYNQQKIKKDSKEEIFYWLNKARRNDVDFTKLLSSFKKSFQYSEKQDQQLDQAKNKNTNFQNSRYTNIKYRKVYDIQEDGIKVIEEGIQDLIQTHPLIPLEFDDKLNQIAKKQFDVLKQRFENFNLKLDLQKTYTENNQQQFLNQEQYNKKLSQINEIINHFDDKGNGFEQRIEQIMGKGSCAESYIIQEFNSKMIAIKHFLDLNNSNRLNRRILLSPDLQKIGIFVDKCPIIGALAVFVFYGNPFCRFSYKFPYTKLDDEKWPEDCTYLEKTIEKKYENDQFQTQYIYTYKWPKSKKEDLIKTHSLEEQAHALNIESQYY